MQQDANAIRWFSSKYHSVSFSKNFLKFSVFSDKLGTNFLKWFIIPKKHCNSFLFSRGCIFLIASTFLLSRYISVAITLCPKKISSLLLNSLLLWFSFNPFFLTVLNTFIVRLCNSCCVLPHMIMSSWE